MTKGLFLKILGIVVVLGGLAVGPLQLVQTGTVTEAAPDPSVPPAPSAPSAPTREHAAHETTALPVAAPVADASSPPSARPMRRLADRIKGKRANFVSVCRYSHSAKDDPIVYPGQPGASHLHDFFGNTSTDAYSTYESLQANDETTCRIDGDTAAYWVPALYDSGQLVKPSLARIYYTPGRKDHATIQPFPAGLKVVAKDRNAVARWSCVGRDQRTKGQTDVPTCPDGTHLVLHLRFPDCWDGHNLDSADHTSHMAFARTGSCPASHPVPVPALTLNVHYRSDGGDIVLGSPDMPVAAHADFFNAWDQQTLERLVRVCLDAGVHCGSRPPGT